MDLYNDLEEICERLSKELKKANEKLNGREMTAADTAYMDQLLHSLKSVKTVMAMMDSENEDDGRSYEGRSYEGRSYRGTSGRSGRRRDAMGRYSGRGYSRDGYSMDSNEMVSELRELMQDAPDDRTRQEFQRFIQKIESMA
jgi:uncharacterized membrane protein